MTKAVRQRASAKVAVELRDSGGNLLGTSSTETTAPQVPGDPIEFNPTLTTFEFGAPVALTPGATYTIEMLNVEGVARASYTLDEENPMSGPGAPWFREGLGVDPTALDPANALSYVGSPTCMPSPVL